MQRSIISEHLFVFPFSWKYHRKNNDILFHQHTQIKGKSFERLGHWTPHVSSITSDKDYNEHVYFYKPIRMALYTFQGAPVIVRNYKYEGLDENSYFKLEKDETQYVLGIKQIDLKLYKTGIGLLSFRLTNHSYKSIEAIEAINSFGQCVYPPVLPIKRAREAGMPNRVEIYLNNENHIVETFEDRPYDESLTISVLIMSVLGKPFTCKADHTHSDEILIEPILGNQMFCCCMYYEANLVKALYEETRSLKEITCLMSINKRNNALEEIEKLSRQDENTYLKCKEHLYGINRFMLLCITTEQVHDKLYDQLVKLVLMQRATLLNLSYELARISTLPKCELSSAISSIYEIYIQFINQLYFKEVTEDSEGAYIYEQLSKAFKIEEELNQLNFEIDEVHEYATLVEQSASNVKVQLLTIIGAALVIPSFVTGFFGMNIFQKEALRWWDNRVVVLWLNSYVVLPILVVVAFCTWTRRRNTKSLLIKVILGVLLLISVSFTFKYGCGL